MIAVMTRGKWAACLLVCMLFLGGCASSPDGGGNDSSASIEAVSYDTQTLQTSDAKSANDVEGERSLKAGVLNATLNGESFRVDLADNDTASALVALLPLEVEMSELNGNEKYVYLGEALPSNPANPGSIEAGDVMLYGANCLVIFYEPHPTTYSYTRIGKIADTSGLAETLGKGSITAVFTTE